MQDPDLLVARRERAVRGWELDLGAVVIASGLPVPVAGTDQFHDFHAHPEFVYLAGRRLEGAVLAFDPGEGWTLFAHEATEDERIWVGDTEPLAHIAETSAIDRVRPSVELQRWLEQRRAEPVALLGNHDITHRPAEYGVPGWQSLELAPDEELAARLSERIAELRRAKDPAELALMRSAAYATRQGHLAAMRLARPGITERDLQIEVEAEFFRHGSERTAYGSILGSGPNAAILHKAPTARVMHAGELLLMDAAAEYGGYASDVTRTFPVGARYQGIQRDLYELVLSVQQHAISQVRPGQEYRDLHLRAAEGIARGLVDLGILRGAPQDLVERDAHALFFVHGLGHMLGLATHDAGGCLPGREPSDRFGLKWLRADLPLQPGYVVTVEPGIYFIRAVLEDPKRREAYRDAVNWDRVDELLDFGGIRIEDDVLVTETGAEVLTSAIPKTIDEVEALRREALLPS
ncbi:MAG TPA: aminopeptidase P family protein [Tepidiformaceae bacterium]|nr:aminopeptidase P family protein [Tepidiformaceae bacterium]